MNDLSPKDRRIRAVLIEHARASEGDREKALLTYTQLGEAVEESLGDDEEWVYPNLKKPFRGLGEALGHISEYEFRLGRPLISSLVVQNESRKPGPGFLGMLVKGLGVDPGSDPDAWVEDEQLRVAELWTNADPDPMIEAAFVGVHRVLDEIRRDLKKAI